ncbi:MAG: hypothetical protein QNJ12_01555 [Ilumatobacter sp.]|uniref:hypothetical protein n=1 Tax=Ilumatobacter sp. TaxID=1967498 RepID=UPI002615546C|nr:hypothetical protein [Ilumatobacter sp.]MDJ0767440.1 hypothetical protein [Ilumatobacter sp.]
MMADAGVAQLLVRMVVSLGIVLTIVAIAYGFARRRATGGPGTRGARRHRLTRASRRSSAPAVEVVGRIGLTRGSAVIALRFGNRIVLVSANDQAPATVLAEMPAEEWDEQDTVREPLPVPEDPPPTHSLFSRAATRPGFLEALREATARHA